LIRRTLSSHLPLMYLLGAIMAMSSILLAINVLAASCVASDENPSRLATSGRLDLAGDAATLSIDQGQILASTGGIERMNWVPQADRSRSYTVNFAATHTAWREFAVRFTPAGNGVVTLTLMGPWEEASKGVLYKEEVLWDALSVDGAEIENGSFELAADSAIHGWLSNGGNVELASPPVPAVDGNHVARTWHNATLAAKLMVTANKPVTIRGYARAAVPVGFQDMRRIAGRDTLAHHAAKRFMRGTNLGNYLEAPPGQNWGSNYSAEDIEVIKREGFDHVRLPIAWHHYTGAGPEFVIKDEIFAKADFLVSEATKHELAAIINIHHFDAFTSDPAGQRDKFLAIWRQLAAHYAASPPSVALELLNEPKDAATTESLNPIYADAIREIRKSSPNRTIFVGPGKWNQVSELAQLRLPDDDTNLIVTVHCYDPFQFTHQGASWAGADARRLQGIVFPGPPSQRLNIDPAWQLSSGTVDWVDRYNTTPTETNPSSARAFRGVVRQAKEWSEYYGRPVHMGEFGAYIAADAQSRANYYRMFRAALDEAGIGWAMWDWKAGFRYWDSATNQPAFGMRDALFPTGSKRD
jgi:endoglucanase